MLDDVTDAMKFAEEVGNLDAFSSNKLYRKAIIMSILNIGELTKKLPQEFKSSNKEIPWRKITGMRDIAAHGYHEMDDEIIWDVVTYSIPELRQFLDKQLNESTPLG
ncbi:MAG: DUF86 domain-containing protein [Defluviitaleaceae bacterium]|nr:DUF86 domain-containing protein [Defluviitaleaceae bacterium]